MFKARKSELELENDADKSEAFLPLIICINFPQILLETKILGTKSLLYSDPKYHNEWSGETEGESECQ